jgi:KaiC/GvpD/RAD55 family RecA-like ATPase
MDRTPIGIRGLDELIEGGLPRGSWTLIYGENGTGKTVIGMEFIWQGLCAGEPCVFELTDQPVARLRAYFRSFGWDVDPFEKTQQLHVRQVFPGYMNPPEPHVTYVLGRPTAQATRFFHEERLKQRDRRPPSKLVADNESLNLIRGGYEEEMRNLEWAKAWAVKYGVTGLRCVTRDLQDPHAEAMLRQYHDNIIELRLGDAGRELRIVKMFATEHPLDWMPFEISRQGLQLKRKQMSPMGYAQYRE